jgi:hypothetical protein
MTTKNSPSELKPFRNAKNSSILIAVTVVVMFAAAVIAKFFP